MFFPLIKVNSIATIIKFCSKFFNKFLDHDISSICRNMTQHHLSNWFFLMSIISNYQIKMLFFLTYKKIDVNCLSILKFVFFVMYNFKLLTKVKNSTKYCYALIFFFSIAKLKHISYNNFKHLFDIVDIDWNEIFIFNFDRFFFFLQNTNFKIFRRRTVKFTFFEMFDESMLKFRFFF